MKPDLKMMSNINLTEILGKKMNIKKEGDAEKVIATGDVNRAIRNMGYKEIISVEKLKSMGFIPAFETNVGVYWKEETINLVAEKLKLFETVTTQFENKASTISLRDYFAAQAMNSFLRGCSDAKADYHAGGIAIMAYQMADAMMKERKI